MQHIQASMVECTADGQESTIPDTITGDFQVFRTRHEPGAGGMYACVCFRLHCLLICLWQGRVMSMRRQMHHPLFPMLKVGVSFVVGHDLMAHSTAQASRCMGTMESKVCGLLWFGPRPTSRFSLTKCAMDDLGTVDPTAYRRRLPAG